MSSHYMISATRKVEEILRTIWVQARNSWLIWSKGEDIVNAKVFARFARHD